MKANTDRYDKAGKFSAAIFTFFRFMEISVLRCVKSFHATSANLHTIIYTICCMSSNAESSYVSSFHSDVCRPNNENINSTKVWLFGIRNCFQAHKITLKYLGNRIAIQIYIFNSPTCDYIRHLMDAPARFEFIFCKWVWRWNPSTFLGSPKEIQLELSKRSCLQNVRHYLQSVLNSPQNVLTVDNHNESKLMKMWKIHVRNEIPLLRQTRNLMHWYIILLLRWLFWSNYGSLAAWNWWKLWIFSWTFDRNRLKCGTRERMRKVVYIYIKLFFSSSSHILWWCYPGYKTFFSSRKP